MRRLLSAFVLVLFVAPNVGADDWEPIFRQRLKWWSLQPVRRVEPPAVKVGGWCRTDVDRFILAALEAKGLAPNHEAERRVLARRLSFALTGLPPNPGAVEQFVSDPSSRAIERYTDALLTSPHFGERWARHWMDVVHYSDTHGYEWDVPIKGAWRYRDYLTRAFNADVPFDRMIREQIAGDLLEPPRIDPTTGLNESLVGTAALFLGERRHGDSDQFAGISEEGIDNVIDTVGKAFLGTTVACAHCHDHKLDALSQQDYYALFGVFMSSRWVARSLYHDDPNAALLPKLESIKGQMRPLLAEAWLKAAKVASAPQGLPEASEPASVHHLFSQLSKYQAQAKPAPEAWRLMAEEYRKLNRDRAAANAKTVRPLADFTTGRVPDGWHGEGLGVRSGFVTRSDFAVSLDGERAVAQILPPGLHTHRYSPRLGGAVRSPLLGPDAQFVSSYLATGGPTVQRTVVAHAQHPEGPAFVNSPGFKWNTTATRAAPPWRVYVEIATAGLNVNYPPRVGLLDEASKKEPTLADHSWFGLSRVSGHQSAATAPQDELKRFLPLFDGAPPATYSDAAAKINAWIDDAVRRWRDGKADQGECALLDELLQAGLLPNRSDASPALADLVRQYREIELRLVPDAASVGLADYGEGRDERVGVRGSWTEFGPSVPRGNIRFLDQGGGYRTTGSGRRELAQSIASPANPLTARVYVNRVWQYLFGEGLVRTVDDFGHLGERPSHPELLDYLAARFVAEGWSTKKLIRLLVTSAAWRQGGECRPAAVAVDPENRLWHHYPLRRLDAESVRDSLLAVSGRLDPKMFGPPINPHRLAEDPEKRLKSGPLDGNGRRSLYLKMTLMEPPRFLALFNQPIPKVTVGKRDVTNVPDQALALLNDPFVIGQAKQWADRLMRDGSPNVESRIEGMFRSAFGRPPTSVERQRFVKLAREFAELRGGNVDQVMSSTEVWQDVAHALFNLKEFIYVR